MTREELIHHIRYSIDINADIILTNDEGEEVIKALEQEPCDDCISRETARRIVDSGRTRQQMIDMILATPPVTPQAKTGHWEVLDKIRAEIEDEWQSKKYPSSPFFWGLRRAIDIIDKYKAESEEKENQVPWYLKIFNQDILNEYQKRMRDATPKEDPYNDKGSSIHSEVYEKGE